MKKWLSEYWPPLLMGLVGVLILAVMGFAIWQAATAPTCEELGGTLVQTGTRSESYVVSNIKVGEVNVPVYGQRTVAVYDCRGEK